MNPLIADKWATALESGKYAQGKGKLQHGPLFCCLGVLCDLAKKEGVEVHCDTDGKILGGFLHVSVMEWAEMSSCSGEMYPDNSLLFLNDSGKTFVEIAKVIRENVETL